MVKKKNFRSQMALIVIVVLCLVTVAVIALCRTLHTEGPDPSSDSVSGSDSNPVSSDSATDVSPIQTTNSGTFSDDPSVNNSPSFSKDLWYLILVNGDHPLSKNSAVPTLTRVKSVSKYQGDRTMDDRCVEAMNAMLTAAKEDGVELFLCSSYRSYERQEENFNNKVAEFKKKGYSDEQAFAETAKIIAVPGTSEHHTGLAADIVTPSYQNLNPGFDKTDAFKWLYAHCSEYGFILRYPEDKEDITKIIYEPWHYRYVGKEAAEIIMKEGLCLEEFLDKYGI